MRFNKIRTDIIEDYRKAHKMTIKDFCEFCNISQYAYRKFMNKNPVKIKVIFKIVNVLNISSDKLLGLK